MTSADGWVLLTAIYTADEEPASLEQIIRQIDYLNHAIVTFEEMAGAVDRLTARGLITFAGGRFSPTVKSIAYYRSIARPTRRVFDELHDMEAYIRAQELQLRDDPGEAGAGAATPVLERSEFERAVKSYLGKANRPSRRRKK